MRDDPKMGFLGPGHSWPAKIEAARRLRREATPAERSAWELLRRNAIRGHYFRRQVVVEGFIVDFFCAKLRLVVELDGEIHETPEQAAYDLERDLVLTRRGLRVVRLRNREVFRERLEAIILEHEGPNEEPLPRQGEG